MVRTALAVAVILALASSGVNAQSTEGQPPGALPSETQPGSAPPDAQEPEAPPPGAGFRAACQQDLAQFCSQVRPGGGRLKSCMRQHIGEVSSGCRQAIRQARQSRSQ
jgi:hypothetical protein